MSSYSTQQVLASYAANVLSAFNGVVEKPTGWLASCPCPGHGSDGKDASPSVRITIGEGGKLLVKCRVGCPTSEILQQIGLHPRDLFPPTGELPMEPLVSNSGTSELAYDEIILRSKLYRETLDSLELVSQHRQSLHARGFSPEEIERYGYKSLRSLDRSAIANSLYNKYRETLYDIPGFEEGNNGGPFVPTYFAGILVPLRHLSGQIIGLKTRRMEGTTRYYLWSTKSCPATNICHVPLHDPELDRGETIRITEGELKADLAFARTGTLTLSVPGVSSWKEALPILQVLAPKRVLLAFDWPDVQSKLGVCHAAHDLAHELMRLGYEVGLEKWDKEKGIDDALKADQPIVTVWGPTVLVELLAMLNSLLTVDEAQDVDAWTASAFPLEVFPPAIASFVQQTADILSCPADYCAAGVMACVSRALGATRVVSLEGGWTETAHLFLCIVAPSASGKSPALKRALKPLKRIQKKIFDQHMEQKATYSAYMRQLKFAKKGNGDMPKKEEKPPTQLWHLWSADITCEAVAGRLMDNQIKHSRRDPSLLIHRDEILGWVRSFNAYRGQGADKEFWLSVFSGEDIKVDRKTNDETVVVDRPAVTVLGGIQPDLLGKIQPEGNTEDGFLPRFLFYFPKPPDAYVPSVVAYDKSLDKVWATSLRRLLAFQPGKSGPKKVRLTEEAAAGWIAWQHALALEQKAPTFDNRMKVFYGKLRQHAARLLLNIHFLRYATGEDENLNPRRIDLETLNRVQKLMLYFANQYTGILWQMPMGPLERRITDFVRWVRLEHKGKVTVRSIYRAKKFGTLGKRDAIELCRLAEDRGFGHLVKEDNRGKVQESFLLSSKTL